MNEAPRIGLDEVHIAKVISDDANGIVYDTPIALKGAVNATVNPNSDVATDYGDNGVFFVTNNRGNTEMNLELIDVDPTVLAQMLGQRKVNGVTIETPLDQSPYFAVGFRVWIAGENDGEEEARALASLLKRYMRGMPIHVNLIRVNEVKERKFTRGSTESVRRFAEVLSSHGVNATVRRRLGSDIDGACGQLRRSVQQESAK